MARSADAHVGHVVSRAERYIKFDVRPDGLRLVVSMSYGPAQSLLAMRDGDANEDGELTQAEADGYMERWTDALAEGLVVSVNGQPQPMVFAEPYFDPLGTVRAAPGAVEAVAMLQLSPGSYTVEVEDRMATRNVDRTDVVFRAATGGELLGGGRDEALPEPSAVAYGPSNDPIRLVCEMHVPGVPLWAYGVAGSILCLLLLGLWIWLRRKASAG